MRQFILLSVLKLYLSLFGDTIWVFFFFFFRNNRQRMPPVCKIGIVTIRHGHMHVGTVTNHKPEMSALLLHSTPASVSNFLARILLNTSFPLCTIFIYRNKFTVLCLLLGKLKAHNVFWKHRKHCMYVLYLNIKCVLRYFPAKVQINAVQ